LDLLLREGKGAGMEKGGEGEAGVERNREGRERQGKGVERISVCIFKLSEK